MKYTILLHSSAGGRSHIGPMLNVAEELMLQGHTVAYAALEDNLVFVDGTNTSSISLGSPGLLAGDMVELWHQRMGEARGSHAQWAFQSMVREGAPTIYMAEFPPLLRAAKELAPDLVVCDFFSQACKDVAEALSIPLVVSFQALDWPGIPMAHYMTSNLSYGRLSIDTIGGWVHDWYAFLFRQVHIRLLRLALDGVRYKYRIGTGQPLSGLHYGLGVSTSFLGFEPPQHLPSNLKVVGPLLPKASSDLAPDLKRFLDAHISTLYIGFGSHVQLLAREVEAILGGVALAMDQGVIDSVVWGMASTPSDRFPPVADNIRILPWAQQSLVLAHTATRLVLTHGGIESSFEAIHAQTPIICMPFFGDQPRNARKLVDAGVAEYLEPLHLSPTSLATALVKVATNTTHLRHLRRMKAILDAYNTDRIGPSVLLNHIRIAKECRPSAPHIPFSGTPPCELRHLIPPSPQPFNYLLVTLSLLVLPVLLLRSQPSKT
ncbi:hypothetical protein DSO57_1023035 [Entomophthora muscae]|uniref:Uncharacterized protein n=1 Tax=Entomophthora muscae TaxID=34485 RepID=A0ACC2UCY4_9FUNG|nr:hypothetical protein DSO57_1023035 [Entomophthora muscae]